MSEYRTYQRMTCDPVLSAAYARIADLHDEADQRRKYYARNGHDARPTLRLSVARLLHRCADRLEPRSAAGAPRRDLQLVRP